MCRYICFWVYIIFKQVDGFVVYESHTSIITIWLNLGFDELNKTNN